MTIQIKQIHFNFTGKAILDDHQKNVQFSSAADFKAANYNSKPAPKMIESTPYIYEEMSLYFEGPRPPTNEEEVTFNNFNKHIRPAEEWEIAAGYVESIGACRALQEAMSSLFFDEF